MKSCSRFQLVDVLDPLKVLGCVYLKWDEVNAALKCCNQCGAICRTTQDGHDCINDINQCTTIQIPSPTPSRSEPRGRRGNGYLLWWNNVITNFPLDFYLASKVKTQSGCIGSIDDQVSACLAIHVAQPYRLLQQIQCKLCRQQCTQFIFRCFITGYINQ